MHAAGIPSPNSYVHVGGLYREYPKPYYKYSIICQDNEKACVTDCPEIKSRQERVDAQEKKKAKEERQQIIQQADALVKKCESKLDLDGVPTTVDVGKTRIEVVNEVKRRYEAKGYTVSYHEDGSHLEVS